MIRSELDAAGVHDPRLREAYEQNIKIPEDLSVVGFDNIHLAEFTIPPLTTVQMSQHDLAKIAFDALLHEVEYSSASPERHNYELVTSAERAWSSADLRHWLRLEKQRVLPRRTVSRNHGRLLYHPRGSFGSPNSGLLLRTNRSFHKNRAGRLPPRSWLKLHFAVALK